MENANILYNEYFLINVQNNYINQRKHSIRTYEKQHITLFKLETTKCVNPLGRDPKVLETCIKEPVLLVEMAQLKWHV